MADYNNYDQCSPPICPDNLSVEIVQYPSSRDFCQGFKVFWRINNPDNVPITI